MYRSNQSRLFWTGLVMGTCITLAFTTGVLSFNTGNVHPFSQSKTK